MHKSYSKAGLSNRRSAKRARSLKAVPLRVPAALAADINARRDEILAAPKMPPPNPVQPQRLITGGSDYRKEFAVTSGLLDYFPDACAAVAQVSYFGNEKHNPGEPMHHARGKSMDHADCISRHLLERGGFDTIVVNGVERQVRHSAALAWRALALCQEEIERAFGLACPRGATALPTRK